MTEVWSIDGKSCAGMLGVVDSIGYHAHVTRRAVNNYERWYADALVPNAGIHEGDRIGTGTVAFRIDGGAGAGGSWGNWVCILGSADTPADPLKTYYNIHKLMLVACERTGAYFIQLAFGASGAAGLAAYTYTEFVYKPQSTSAEETPYIVRARRQPAGTLAWARCWAVAFDTGTLDFYLATHEYEG